jgi:hypothetical protein
VVHKIERLTFLRYDTADGAAMDAELSRIEQEQVPAPRTTLLM